MWVRRAGLEAKEQVENWESEKTPLGFADCLACAAPMRWQQRAAAARSPKLRSRNSDFNSRLQQS